MGFCVVFDGFWLINTILFHGRTSNLQRNEANERLETWNLRVPMSPILPVDGWVTTFWSLLMVGNWKKWWLFKNDQFSLENLDICFARTVENGNVHWKNRCENQFPVIPEWVWQLATTAMFENRDPQMAIWMGGIVHPLDLGVSCVPMYWYWYRHQYRYRYGNRYWYWWCIDVLMYWCIGVLIYWCIDLLMYFCIDVLMHWCIDVLMYWCIDVSM